MSSRAERDPVLDEWRENLAAQLRAILAIQMMPQADLARAMGMQETALSRRLLGKVSFSAEELLFLADWMNRNIDEIMAAAKARQTSVCLALSDPANPERFLWHGRGKQLAAELFGVAAALRVA